MRPRLAYELGISSTMAGATLLLLPLTKAIPFRPPTWGWLGAAVLLVCYRGAIYLGDCALRAALPPPGRKSAPPR